ncbi:hypothetical protein L1857_23010 [Amycolatopsis thermalba]|uniref:Nitroreductase domain-containing protein n=1 Tax=Amycolatopsis thermalba TaxID=944492 RepID=A0ABY4NZF2_9PSEU|nr:MULTISPECIES: hypothetical protein [Amycolatopsis]UQS25475.1 hypothetical protein L1857_23010 [Amycolatopsis thermalba]
MRKRLDVTRSVPRRLIEECADLATQVPTGRNRGLGTVWTTAHAPLEKELAATLGVPHDEIMLAALIPLAFTLGTDFRPAPRIGRGEVLHWDRW